MRSMQTSTISFWEQARRQERKLRFRKKRKVVIILKIKSYPLESEAGINQIIEKENI